MVQDTAMVPARTLGLDVSDRVTHVCVVDDAGRVVVRDRVATRVDAVTVWAAAQPPARVVLETGPHSPWISRTVAAAGHEVLVANPRQLRLIYGARDKGDRQDAERLARLGRLDPALLHPIQHRGAGAQADLAVLRARDQVVRVRSALINHARGAVKAVGARLPKCDACTFASHVRGQLPAVLAAALAPVVELIATLTQTITGYDRTVTALANAHYPETARLTQVRGIGALTALAYVLVLEDPTRFAQSRAVGPYLGLVPRRNQSGHAAPELHITKTGDRLLRRLLVSAAQYLLGPFGGDSRLRRWGLRRIEQAGKNGKKRIVVAVARKLAVLLHRLWVSGARYEALGLSA